MAKVLVPYYSSYGHVEKARTQIAVGAREAGASPDVKHVPELLSPEAAKAANYKLDQTTSPSTTRWARASAGCRPKWQASSTRLAAYGRREPSRAR